MLLKPILLALALGAAWTNASANFPPQDHAGDLHGRDMASPDPARITHRPFIGFPIDAARNRLAGHTPPPTKKTPCMKPFRPHVFTV